MNFTVRPTILAHKANSKGIASIRIAVTINREITYRATTHRIHTSQWDAERRLVTGHPNAGLINADLKKEVAKIEDNILRSKLQEIPVTRAVIDGDRRSQVGFAKFAREIKAVEKEITRVLAFAGTGLLISAIDVTFLRRFEEHERARGMAQNTLNTTFKQLRRILNQAKAEGLIKATPFDEYDIPRYMQSDRLYLTEEELSKLTKLLDQELPRDLYITLCYFLLGCYSGLRHSDWIRFNAGTMVDGDLLKLRAKKNNASVVLPIGPTLHGVIARVAPLPRPYTNQKCNEKLKLLSILAGIKKPISTHTGRHSFGYLCASNRLPKSVTAELLGVTTQTVEVYYHLSGSNILQQAAILSTL